MRLPVRRFCELEAERKSRPKRSKADAPTDGVSFVTGVSQAVCSGSGRVKEMKNGAAKLLRLLILLDEPRLVTRR